MLFYFLYFIDYNIIIFWVFIIKIQNEFNFSLTDDVPSFSMLKKKELSPFKTPLGMHVIKRKIGDEAILNSIFVARANTNKLAEIMVELMMRDSSAQTRQTIRDVP